MSAHELLSEPNFCTGTTSCFGEFDLPVRKRFSWRKMFTLKVNKIHGIRLTWSFLGEYQLYYTIKSSDFLSDERSCSAKKFVTNESFAKSLAIVSNGDSPYSYVTAGGPTPASTVLVAPKFNRFSWTTYLTTGCLSVRGVSLPNRMRFIFKFSARLREASED